MKTSHVLLLLLSFFTMFFLAYSILSQTDIEYSQQNIEYGNVLAAACHDAAKTIEHGNQRGSGVWEDKGSIETTLNVFYKTLTSGIGYKNTLYEEYIETMVPFVILTDYNGYYVVYAACFDETGNAIVPEDIAAISALTNLNTWSRDHGGHIVRYYLNDYIEVLSRNNKHYSGSAALVYADMLKAGEDVSSLAFFTNSEEYELKKRNTIILTLEDHINYILNTQIADVDGYNTGYEVTLTEVDDATWQRALKNPTVLAFLQGQQATYSFMGKNSHFANVFAYAGGESKFKPSAVLWKSNADAKNHSFTEQTTTKNGVDISYILSN